MEYANENENNSSNSHGVNYVPMERLDLDFLFQKIPVFTPLKSTWFHQKVCLKLPSKAFIFNVIYVTVVFFSA